MQSIHLHVPRHGDCHTPCTVHLDVFGPGKPSWLKANDTIHLFVLCRNTQSWAWKPEKPVLKQQNSHLSNDTLCPWLSCTDYSKLVVTWRPIQCICIFYEHIKILFISMTIFNGHEPLNTLKLFILIPDKDEKKTFIIELTLHFSSQ